jgi:DNA polymerase-3 subunit epsilon
MSAAPAALDRLRRAARTIRLRLRLGSTDWRDLALWALDLETGGLRPDTDPVLSIGMVPLRDGAVGVGRGFHAVVRPDAPVGEDSLTVHHILHRDLEGAPRLVDLLPAVAERIRGGVVIVHQRSVDVPFLRAAFRRGGLEMPPFLVVDTVHLLLRYAHRHGHLTPQRREFPTGLAEARARFGLPPHRAHEALSDAVATAELFLVLAHRLRARRLSQLL